MTAAVGLLSDMALFAWAEAQPKPKRRAVVRIERAPRLPCGHAQQPGCGDTCYRCIANARDAEEARLALDHAAFMRAIPAEMTVTIVSTGRVLRYRIPRQRRRRR